jgi:hypothetical protein
MSKQYSNTKNKPSEMTVITKAKDLCNYVMTVTQKSPKQFRFSYVGRLQNLTLGIVENVIRANDLMIGGTHGSRHAAERHDLQKRALTDVKLLAYLAEMASTQQCLLFRQYEQIARLTTDCQYLLAGWINSDRKRLSPTP